MQDGKEIERDLRNRVKELECLYGLSKVVQRSQRLATISDEIYQEIVNLLPNAWQYPEITCARITIDNSRFETDNWVETEWKQSSDIIVHGVKAGTVEVCYLEERLSAVGDLFLREERQLINTVAGQLGRINERMEDEALLREREEFNISLLRNSPNPIIVINPDTSVRYINKSFEDLTGFTSAEIIGSKAPYPWWTGAPEKDFERLKREMREGSHRREREFTPAERDLSPGKIDLRLSELQLVPVLSGEVGGLRADDHMEGLVDRITVVEPGE